MADKVQKALKKRTAAKMNLQTKIQVLNKLSENSNETDLDNAYDTVMKAMEEVDKTHDAYIQTLLPDDGNEIDGDTQKQLTEWHSEVFDMTAAAEATYRKKRFVSVRAELNEALESLNIYVDETLKKVDEGK